VADCSTSLVLLLTSVIGLDPWIWTTGRHDFYSSIYGNCWNHFYFSTSADNVIERAVDIAREEVTEKPRNNQQPAETFDTDLILHTNI